MKHSRIAVLATLMLLVTYAPADTRTEQLRALLDEDSWQEALREARRTVLDRPEDPDSRSVLGEALYRAGEIEEAASVLHELKEQEVLPPRGAMTLALIRAAEGRFAEGAKLASEAVMKAPDDLQILYWASGFQESRADTVAILERYIELGEEREDADRLEGARGSIRLFRALGERQVWIPTQRPERMELPLKLVPDGRGGVVGYLVKTVFGTRKKPVRLLLDTGSSGLFLSERAARKRGFAPLSEETTFGGGGSGRHSSNRGVFENFSMGELSFSEALATTSPGAIDPYLRYQGLLGIAILEGYIVTLDLGNKMIRLEQSSEPLENGLPYWVVSGNLLVRAAVEGGPGGLFLLDTGANSTLLDLRFARSVQGAVVGDPSRVTGFGGSRQGARLVERLSVVYQGLSTGGAPLNAVDLGMRSRLSGIEISGFLGLDMLAGSTITFDTVRRRVSINK